MLSDKAVKILADKIAPEIIEELAISEEFITFLHEELPALIENKLGDCEPDLLFDLALQIMERITLTT
jgi:hypothetical protein